VFVFAEAPDVQAELAGTDIADPWDFFDSFRAVWPSVRYAEGEGPLDVAFRQAGKVPVPWPGGCSPSYALLLSTGFYLQQARGDEVILLPVTRLAALLRKSPDHTAKLIRLALFDGYLLPDDLNYSYRARKARTFRFNLTRVPASARRDP
jgi:hypothetical protein